MSEVIVCETDSEFLCFPFNDNPLHYMNSFPQTNFKLKWLDNKEDMLKLLDYMNNSDNLIEEDDYYFLYTYISEDVINITIQHFIDDISEYLSNVCIISQLNYEGKYDDRTFIMKVFNLYREQSIFVKSFLLFDDEKISLTNWYDNSCKIIREVHRVSEYEKSINKDNINREKITERVIKDFIFEKLYEEVDNYYGYDDDEEIPKGEIN